MRGSVVLGVAAMAAGLLLGQPAPAAPPAGWGEVLDRLADQSAEAIASGGMTVVDMGPEGIRRTRVDYRTGYGQQGRYVFSWAERGYRQLTGGAVDRQVRRTLGRPDAAWVTDSFSSPLELFPQSRVLGEKNAPVAAVVRTDTGAGCTEYRVRWVAGDGIQVSICPGRTTLVTSERTLVWTPGVVHVEPPGAETVVADDDYDDALEARVLRRQANGFVAQMRRRARASADPVQAIRRVSQATWGSLRVATVPDGVVMRAHNRYIDRTWTVTYRDRLRVRRDDRHPPSWTPPRTAVRVAPVQPATQVGRQAVVQALRSIAWSQRQPGQRVLLGDDAPVAMDNISGVSAVLNDGRAVLMRGPRGLECEAIERTKRVRQALHRLGKPHARYGCGAGIAVFLEFSPILGPGGWLMPLMPMLHGASTTVRADSIAVAGWARLTFVGEALTRIDYLKPSMQDIGGVRYRYGPQDLRMPSARHRVAMHRLSTALQDGS